MIRDILLAVAVAYLMLSFAVFSVFFLFFYEHGAEEAGKKTRIKGYSMFDHFWMCLALGLSWPYGLKIVMLGSRDE